MAMEPCPSAVLRYPIATHPNPAQRDAAPVAKPAVPLTTLALPNPAASTPETTTPSPKAKVPKTEAVVAVPPAQEKKPTLASSHWVPSTDPARNATLYGYHIIRTPAPVAGM
jgi:hypothetical protein